jgi:trehalose synthase
MVEIQEVRVGVQPLERFSEVVPEEQLKRVLRAAAEARQRLSKRVVWNVNSTAVGGGVAELLPSLLGYTRSVGIDSRWVVISGNEAFFRVTKRLHHALHGSPGDGTPLDEAAREVYESTLRDNALELNSVVQEGDIVILHDPQTAGLAQGLIHAGAKVVWRCHIGLDSPNEEAETGWEFLRPYLEPISRFVFSRQTYVPAFCDHGKSDIITPSIDAFCSPRTRRVRSWCTRAWSRGRRRTIPTMASCVTTAPRDASGTAPTSSGWAARPPGIRGWSSRCRAGIR